MHFASENPEAVRQRAVARGWLALGRVVFAFGVLAAIAGFASVMAVGNAIATGLSRGSHCDGCGPAATGSGVLRAGNVVGVIQQVAAPRGDRSLQMFLATSSGLASPALDSARAGQLRARLDQDPRSVIWLIELVPRDSTRGAPVGRLVIGAGQPPLPVWGGGDSAPRP